jgi:hypothetical protein
MSFQRDSRILFVSSFFFSLHAGWEIRFPSPDVQHSLPHQNISFLIYEEYF